MRERKIKDKDYVKDGTIRRCEWCGYAVSDHFKYCPGCGAEFE